MRKFFMMLLGGLSLFLPLQGHSQTEKPQAAVSSMAVMGEITLTQRQIVFNRLLEKLQESYTLVPQKLVEDAQEQAYETLEGEQCTEANCIRKIQEILQVENLFIFQMIRDGQDTQLSLTRVDLENKQVKNDYCERCDTRELNQRVALLVDAFTASSGTAISTLPKEPPKQDLHKELLEKIRLSLEGPIDAIAQAGPFVQSYQSQYAQENLRKSLRASSRGYYHLGLLYRSGLSLDKDDTEAVYWFQKSAEAGHAPAQNRLGFMLDHGYGIDEDDEEAVRWFRQAAEQGSSVAQFNLGSMYRKGYGVEMNLEKAIEWYQKSRAQGNQTAHKVLAWLKENP